MAKEILIVDDEPNVVVPIQFLVEEEGYKVIVAGRGGDGVKVFWG